MAQPPHPTFINMPPPGSNPDTPSEMPGTPTSTTTSLSALSTTAIKDGQRGHLSAGPLGRGHQHSPSTTSLEAERADRISRLAGLERVSTLRAPAHTSSPSPQTTPTSATGHYLTPAYFDSNGQPVAITKMSTVGSASATESHVGDDGRTTAPDEDMLSTGTNYREADSVTSMMGPDHDAMDDDLATRSLGGYDDRISDDGSASLVGFGEGAGSTVSGPIYHRRPPPNAHVSWNLERTVSGLSARDRDVHMSGADSAVQERRDARMVDGVAAEPPHQTNHEAFVDTTFRGPIPAPRQPTRDTPETIVQQLDRGEQRVGSTALSSPGPSSEGPLGRFYFESKKKEN
ncbi:hypothetical protein CDD81_4546 [Ophiocordyceps australis]|uniref:Uncharacterized protein n=1 Tax=Ophiocordyceps australis TaxID=1399860 RepID=A0A2C5YC66_9HYPO|nr:hypothetical protein CDD81_4546 [Ophiocordyceps australis]